MLIAGLMMAAKGFAFPLKENVQKMQMLLHGKVIDGNRGGVGTGIAAVITGRPGDAFASFFGKKWDKSTDEEYMEKIRKILKDPSRWSKYNDLQKIYMMLLCSENGYKILDEETQERSKAFLNLIAPTVPINHPKYTRFDPSYKIGPAINNTVRGFEIRDAVSEMDGYDYYDYPGFIEQVGKEIMRRFF